MVVLRIFSLICLHSGCLAAPLKTTGDRKDFLSITWLPVVGAILIQMLVQYIQISNVEAQMSQGQINLVLSDGLNYLQQGKNFIDPSDGET